VLDTIGFDAHARGADLVVTGEGTVDETTFAGKAPGAVLSRCRRLGVRCVLFGGRVSEQVARRHLPVRSLSGDPGRAHDDLVALGEELAAG
jgi:glycerate kinase